MAIFNKCHALFLGFLVFAIIGTAGYSVNQGDYFQHQYTFIIIKSLLLFLSFGYAKWFDMISFGMLSRKQLLLFIGIFLLTVLVSISYHAFSQLFLVLRINTLRKLVKDFRFLLLLVLQFWHLSRRNSCLEGFFKVQFLIILGWGLY